MKFSLTIQDLTAEQAAKVAEYAHSLTELKPWPQVVAEMVEALPVPDVVTTATPVEQFMSGGAQGFDHKAEVEKKRGRPPGTKNKPKEEAPPAAAPAPTLGEKIDVRDEEVSPELEKAIEHVKTIAKEPLPEVPKSAPPPVVEEKKQAFSHLLDLRGVWGLSTPDSQPWRPDHGGLVDADVVGGLKLGDLRDTKNYNLRVGRFRIAKELATANGIDPVEATEPSPESDKLTELLMEVAAAGVPCLGPDRPREWFEKAAITGLMELYVDLH